MYIYIYIYMYIYIYIYICTRGSPTRSCYIGVPKGPWKEHLSYGQFSESHNSSSNNNTNSTSKSNLKLRVPSNW